MTSDSGSNIFVNSGVEMPPAPAPASSFLSGGGGGGNPGAAGAANPSLAPLPSPSRRPLDQEEFNRRLKAKRALFSKSRSLSLASFRRLPALPVRRPGRLIPSGLKVTVTNFEDDDEEYLKQNR